MISTDLLGCTVETDDGMRGVVRVVHTDVDQTLWLYIQVADGKLRAVDVLEEGVCVVDASPGPVTAVTLSREHIEAVRVHVERQTSGLSASEIALAEIDLADEDRSTTAVAKVVAAYNRIIGGGK